MYSDLISTKPQRKHPFNVLLRNISNILIPIKTVFAMATKLMKIESLKTCSCPKHSSNNSPGVKVGPRPVDHKFYIG